MSRRKVRRKPMLSNANAKYEVKIRTAESRDIQQILQVLSQSFKPYRQYYTKKAYKATITCAHEIENRIADQKAEVLVAIFDNKIVGTASIKKEERENLHIRSMAVKPTYQGRGIGWRILGEIEQRARQKNCKKMSLTCFEPLTKAASLYKRFGFIRTGKKKNLHGIEIFEMVMQVKV